MPGSGSSDWQALLAFWFGPLDDGLAAPDQRALWFAPNPDFDAQCSANFGPLLAPAAAGEPSVPDTLAAAGELRDWLDEPRGRLAFIILTDQIPRNVYRGTAQAYDWDPLALKAARDGVASGADRSLSWDERAFFYMPFEHSEDILDQHLAVGLFTHLRDESPKAIRSTTGNSLRYAQQHRDIIVRFGRFPHRNGVLRRTSSAAEAAFVAESNGFGQLP